MPSLLMLLLLAAADPAAWYRAGASAEDAGRYPDAVSWYGRIVQEAPQSYQGRRAQSRLDDLRPHAADGFVAYGAFERLLRDYTKLGSDGALAEARRIVAEHPEAAVAPEILFWIGNEYREARGEPDAAIRAYRDVVETFPGDPRAPLALDQIGRLYEQQKKFAEAAKVYAELQQRYPGAVTPQAYEKRRTSATRRLLHKQVARGAWGLIGAGILFFFAVGGWRVDRSAFLRGAARKAGFALLLGLAPAAFLWVYDDLWSPSLTAAGFAFALYGVLLAALAARTRFPVGRAWALAERIVFNVVFPLAIWIVIVHHFQLWEAFGL